MVWGTRSLGFTQARRRGALVPAQVRIQVEQESIPEASTQQTKDLQTKGLIQDSQTEARTAFQIAWLRQLLRNRKKWTSLTFSWEEVAQVQHELNF